MKNSYKILIIIYFAIHFFSCTSEEPKISLNTSTQKTVLVVNEGNFNWQNGSISLIYPDSNSIINNAYKSVNKKALGDVPQSALIDSNFIYIVVNNSGKIVKLNKNTLLQTSEINDLISPRFLLKMNNLAYVSDLYAAKISLIDLTNFVLISTISATKSTEQMLLFNEHIYITNWSNGNKLLVLNTITNEITDSIVLKAEPQSLVLDKNNKLWVLCSGGYNSIDYPALYCINPTTLQIEKQFNFPSKNLSPSQLCINPTKDTLYYLNESVYRFSIESDALPREPIIINNNKVYYGLAISPENQIWISNAKDFVQESEILVYTSNAELLTSYIGGTNASHFYFMP